MNPFPCSGGHKDGHTVNDLFDLDGKTALVTGAAMGLGKAMAEALAKSGCSIAVADMDRDAGKETVAQLEAAGTKALFVEMDVRDQRQVDQAVESTIAAFGNIDILINNAGIGRPKPSLDVSREEWQEVMDINLTGVFFVAQAVGREMIKQKSGAIVNIASMSAFIVNNEVAQCSYYASKAGVVMITKALAAEWADHNIRVNAIAPGVMMTNQTKYMFDDPAKQDLVNKWMGYTPLRRAGNPPELGGAVVYLCSQASSYMTGQVLVVDGGYTIY